MDQATATKGLSAYTTEQLLAAYKVLKEKQPQLPEYRRAAFALLEEIEKRGAAVDRYVAKLKANRKLTVAPRLESCSKAV